MVVAAPPEKPPARKRRKSGELPEGVEQHSLDTLFAPPESPEPEALPASAIEEPPAYVRPVQVRQLDFYALADQEPDPGSWKPGAFGNKGAASRYTPGRRKTKKPATLPEGMSQPTLDDLSVTTSPFAYQEPDARSKKPEEAYRPAPRRRNKAKQKTGLPSGMEQPTLEGLFTVSSDEAQAAPTLATRTEYERPGQPEQHDFETLEHIPSEDGSAIQAGEPARNRTGSNSAELRRHDVRTDGGEEDGLSESLGDGGTSIPSAGGRRVILDEPDPEPQPSRDFRITGEHGVGTGGLHEKASANIAAIRLLKTLEASSREATEEEKAILVRYSGWGALAQVFEPLGPEWRTAAAELQEILTEEEYASARATTPNAHFTSPMVIDAMWEMLERLGLRKGDRVLEPSMGIGHFFGLMPEGLQGGHRTGVELDSITARIAKKLYPDAKIFQKGFEETALPDNYFDMAVGNVPFGNYPVHDPAMKPKLTRSVHDYFFAKTLDKLRPGGIMALVTSRYTMDKKDDVIRKHLAEQADLIGAVRLPNTAFKGNAGTEVTTDILFLQKRAPGKEPAGEAWTQTQTVQIEGREVPLNEYYVKHPEMMLGELTLKGTMYSRDKEPTLAGELTAELLETAMQALPEGVYVPRAKCREPPPAITIADPEAFIGIKDGGYAEVDGKIVIRTGNSFVPTALSVSATARVHVLIGIRDAVREVFRTQLDDEPEEKITAARAALNQVYDRFVSRYGYLTSKENFRAFTGDPDHPLLLSLENYVSSQ